MDEEKRSIGSFRWGRSMKRRAFLGGAAAATLPLSNAVAVQISPKERLAAAVNELKAAAVAANPEIEKWEVKINPRMGCPVLIAGFSA